MTHYTHLDKLGKPLAVDDVVAVADHNSLMIAKVIKLNPKMIKVAKLINKSTWHTGEHNKYSQDCVKVDDADAVIYVLKNL
jgi:hypothetical protein